MLAQIQQAMQSYIVISLSVSHYTQLNSISINMCYYFHNPVLFNFLFVVVIYLYWPLSSSSSSSHPHPLTSFNSSICCSSLPYPPPPPLLPSFFFFSSFSSSYFSSSSSKGALSQTPPTLYDTMKPNFITLFCHRWKSPTNTNVTRNQ